MKNILTLLRRKYLKIYFILQGIIFGCLLCLHCTIISKPVLINIKFSGKNLKLQPEFNSNKKEYLIAPLKSDESTFTFKQFIISKNVNLTINDVPYEGKPLTFSNIKPGPNKFIITLSKGNKSINRYSITVYRALPIYRAEINEHGIEIPYNRFRFMKDGTVLDLKTKLVWLKNANIVGIRTWQEAQKFINDFNRNKIEGNCGFTDWRLPNIWEIRSLQNYMVENSAEWLKEKGFLDPQLSYWSSTTYAINTNYAWLGVFSNIHIPHCQDKTHYYSIWPVRGKSILAKTGETSVDGYKIEDWEDWSVQHGIEWPKPRFYDNKDGTITDNMTGLVWLKNAGVSEIITYGEVKGFIEEFNCQENKFNCGFTDWRVPGVYELESLTTFGQSEVVTWFEEKKRGFKNISVVYWSSTPSIEEYFWTLQIFNGLISHNHRALGNSIWPVRNYEN